ncbi:unnamed protein product [Caenorhabditis brenneri]
MKFQLVFLLAALIGSSQAQSDTEEICFKIPGNNVNIVIDPTQLTQTEVDEIKQLLEDSLSDVLGSLGSSINGTLNNLVGGLTGILNPAALTGNGEICVVLHTFDVDQVEALDGVKDVLTRLANFFNCLKGLEDIGVQFVEKVDDALNDINAFINDFNNCTNPFCQLGVIGNFGNSVQLQNRFSDFSNTVRDKIDQCVTETINA